MNAAQGKIINLLKTLQDFLVLAGVAQWIEHRPVNQKVTGLNPDQGTCLGYKSGPQ